MITIKSLKEIAFESIYQAFKEAFADYEMQLEKEELRRMLQRRGFVPELSYAAFEGNQIVSFTLNGIGYAISEFNSGDITQLAVHKDFRRQGVGTELLRKLIENITTGSLKVINTERTDFITKKFLKSSGIDLSGKQFEMIKRI